MKKISLLTVVFTFALLLHSAAFAQSSGRFEAIYTDLTVEKCKTIESETEGAGWYRGECPGIYGYKLELLEGDIRQTINVITPNGKKSELDFWSNVSSGFSAVGEKAEWRVPKNAKNVRPYALIVRYNTNEDPENTEKLTSRLVIVKIAPSSACITDIVEPIKNANEKARELADAAANKPCKFEEKGQQRAVDSDGQVKEVEAYAKEIEDYVKKEGGPHIVIADASDYNNDEKPLWKKFDSEQQYEESKIESYETAYIWKKDGETVAANFTYSSPSGDWAQYVYYVFRKDGSTARANRELRTFLGDIIVNRIYIYDENGKLLKETKTFRDLATQKPVKAPASFQDIDVDIYKKLIDLPFSSMLSSNAALSGDEMKFIPAGWKLEDRVSADLNGDSMADSILQIKKENSEGDDYDRTLIILFKTKDGSFTKAAESNKIIRCSLCGGVLGGMAADIEVKNGVITISQMYGSREATNYLHRFRYEPKTKKFRLIGEDITNYDRATGDSETTSTNYLTGKQIINKMKYDQKTEKEVLVSTQTKKVSMSKKYLEDIDYGNY